jgi:hypothetical protein
MFKHEKAEMIKWAMSGGTLGVMCAFSLEKGAALAIVLASPATWALVGGGALAGGLIAHAWSRYQHRMMDKEIHRIIKCGKITRRRPKRPSAPHKLCPA